MTLLIYNLLVLAILLFLLGVLVWNLKVVPKVNPAAKPKQYPYVSILVPARNEERNIKRCLTSLIQQDYPDFEILVLDDHSEDATAEIVESFVAKDKRVRLFHGKPLPEGWLGKCYACDQLASRASGELLLFTDADTVHEPMALTAAVVEMERTQADLLTFITRFEMKTFWEKLLLPLVHFIAFAYLPFAFIKKSSNPHFAVANGQFMLFRRSAYEAIDGHQSVRDALVEDVWLGRKIKSQGLKLEVQDGSAVVSCRMYQSLREIWRGFSKNLFAAFNYSLVGISASMIFSFLVYVFPLVMLILGLRYHLASLNWVVLPLLQMAIPIVMRLLLARRFHLGILSSFLHALGVIFFLGIESNSMRWMLFGSGAHWKGRTYNFRNQLKKVSTVNSNKVPSEASSK